MTACGHMSVPNAQEVPALRPAFHRAIRQHKSLPHQITIQQSDFVRDFIFLRKLRTPIDNASERRFANIGKPRAEPHRVMFGQ
jgi:hypothetical protein